MAADAVERAHGAPARDESFEPPGVGASLRAPGPAPAGAPVAERQRVMLGLLTWRRPSFLLMPLSVLLAAGVPGLLVAGAAAKTGLVDPVIGGAVAGGGVLAILVAALFLCAGRGFNFPVLFSTTLSVAHASVFLFGGVLFFFPPALPALRAFEAALPGEAAAGLSRAFESEVATAGLGYAGAFFAVTVMTVLSLLVLRGIGLARAE